MRNDNISERLEVENITERSRKARLGCFGHVEKRGQDCIRRHTLEMVPPIEEEDEHQRRDGWTVSTET